MSGSHNGKVFPSDDLTSRERLLAAYGRQAVDRLPFWAKVTNATWRTSQAERVRRWSDRELLDYIHADGLFGCSRCVAARGARVDFEETRRDSVRTRVTHTPDGDLIERWTMDPATRSWHPTEFPVKSRQDLRRHRWLYADTRIEVLDDQLASARRHVEQIGQRGITHTGWGTSPWMHLTEHVIGPAECVYFLADYPEEMAELMALMHEANLGFVRAVAAHSPADVIVSVENTSTTLLSPEVFSRHCLPFLCDYGRAIESAGKVHELHMCGTLLDLLGQIDTIPAASIEAFTSPPLGNTRLADGKRRSPSKALIGGTCVNVWWRRSRSEIRQYIAGELAACPDHLGIVLTTAGVAPPACTAETFRAIGEWIASVDFRA